MRESASFCREKGLGVRIHPDTPGFIRGPAPENPSRPGQSTRITRKIRSVLWENLVVVSRLEAVNPRVLNGIVTPFSAGKNS